MNAFWKGLVISIIAYQAVLTWCVIKLADYSVLMAHVNSDRDVGLFDTTPGWQAGLILSGTLIVLGIFNVVMLIRSEVKEAEQG